MLEFYKKLSKRQKNCFFVLTVLCSFPIGAILGAMTGLIATSFMPLCCDSAGCHNCFQFQGKTGYVALAALGFWVGIIVFPLLYILFLVYLERK